MLAVGEKLPQIVLADETGPEARTHEGQQFRDLFFEFDKRGVRIVGVSRDSVESHRKFKEKYDLPFILLADIESELCNACGTLVEKNMDGNVTIGTGRSTFRIDPSGSVVAARPRVNVEGHAAEVLSSLP